MNLDERTTRTLYAERFLHFASVPGFRYLFPPQPCSYEDRSPGGGEGGGGGNEGQSESSRKSADPELFEQHYCAKGVSFLNIRRAG